MFYYFLTIDKATTNDGIKPTKEMYEDIFFRIKEQCMIMYTDNVYPVKCFELKEKGSVRKKTKVFDWLHYHSIVKSRLKVIYPRIRGYSVVWKPINNLQTMAFYCGYIQKDKSDKCALKKNIKRLKVNTKVILPDIRKFF